MQLCFKYEVDNAPVLKVTKPCNDQKTHPVSITHCDHVNDFPVVNSTPGIIQDPIDLLLAKCNFTITKGQQYWFSVLAILLTFY